MPVRQANAQWNGTLKEGKGTMKLGADGPQMPFSFGTRFGEEKGTNPEELIGAAHAGCFSMALSKILGDAGHTPDRIATHAKVTVEIGEGGAAISKIHLDCKATIPGLDEAEFQELADKAKTGCPVSKALAGTTIEMTAVLEG